MKYWYSIRTRFPNVEGFGADRDTVIGNDDGEFNICIPLKMLAAFLEHFQRSIVNVKQELVLIRNSNDQEAVFLCVRTGYHQSRCDHLRPVLCSSQFYRAFSPTIPTDLGTAYRSTNHCYSYIISAILPSGFHSHLFLIYVAVFFYIRRSMGGLLATTPTDSVENVRWALCTLMTIRRCKLPFVVRMLRNLLLDVLGPLRFGIILDNAVIVLSDFSKLFATCVANCVHPHFQIFYCVTQMYNSAFNIKPYVIYLSFGC